MHMFVVTLPASAQKNPLSFALRAKKAGADILEIRADLIESLPTFESPLPILLTLRGAHPDWIQILKPAYLDVALSEAAIDVPSDTTIIRSFHDYESTPSLTRLQEIADRLIAAGGSIIKIAVTIHSIGDLVTLERLHRSLPTAQRRVILGMGDKAHLSRLLSPFRNELTYTFLDDSDPSAPGQLPLSLYRQIAHCTQPKIFGLLGGKQSMKSLSPQIHNALFAAHDIDAVYSFFPSDELEETCEALAYLGVRGLSVTAPFKRAVVAKARTLDAVSQRLQSVNTLIRDGDEWAGFNTDIVGIIRGYPFLAGCKHIAILGSGGVVPAIIAACEDLHRGMKIDLFARNRMARSEIEELFDVETHDLERILDADFDCVICSVTEDIAVPLPVSHKQPYAIDLRYGRETKFLKTAQSKNYHTFDGLPMLIHQALRQFELFTGLTQSPDDERLLYDLLRKS